MAYHGAIYESYGLGTTPAPSPISAMGCDNSISHSIIRILQSVLSKPSFCWVSRGVLQLQTILGCRRWSYWTKLSDEIYLGGMPLKNWDHVNKIAKCGVKAVLSLNEDYEFQSQLFADPVKSADWEKKDIKFLNVASPDLQPIEVEKLAKAVDYVADQVMSGNSVYVHCTGGRGRSASVVVCSLARLKGWSLERSIDYVMKLRPQFMLTQAQYDSLSTWYTKELQRRVTSRI